MARFLRLAGIVVLAAAAASCAAVTVGTNIQRGHDFTSYRTFDWGPADLLPTGDARLDRDPFFQDHVEGAVEKGLASLGYARAESGWPDLLVHYHAAINQRIDVAKIDERYGYCYGANCEASLVEYEAGTLVVDVVDARSNKVIWRGWAQHSVEDTLGDQDRTADRISEAIRRMLEHFPRHIATVEAQPVSH